MKTEGLQSRQWRDESARNLLKNKTYKAFKNLIGFFTMKHSQLIGVIAVIALMSVCFIPWSFIASKQIIITGISAPGTEFGKPGLMNIIFGSISLLLFLIPNVWAKRINIFIAAMNLAWAIRNYLLVTTCYLGDCPEKRIGIYLLLLVSVTILMMTFLPKIKLPAEKK